MDKNAIKKYAVWARRELITRVSQRAALYEITAEGYGDTDAVSVHGRILSLEEKNQRRALIAQIQQKGFEQVMEEIAYTWFNRFSALRFMEVNGYLPTRIRVFTDEENNFKPQIMTEAINLEMDGLDMQKVFAFKDANDDEGLFKYLLITQCNALSSILPGMFQKIADYTELLFPDNLLREGSVVEQIVSMIPEEDWTEQVQIIGWLYQYYNTEPKDKVFANLKKNIKISKENIPAATQLFTPDWIVRYMVENSLGRLWIEGHPNDELKARWKYYLDEAEQEEEVQKQLAEIRKEYAVLKPEDIRCIDPCMGSGHILVYMFDVLVQIYESYGYSAREAASSIIEHNIWGLDIDERASQLAYFSVMMKARKYDRRFFDRKVQPHVYAIRESNLLDNAYMERSTNNNLKLRNELEKLINTFKDAEEYGSILKMPVFALKDMYAYIRDFDTDSMLNVYGYIKDDFIKLIKQANVLNQKYHVVVTNPPYLSSSGMNNKLLNYVKKNYADAKADLYAVFIEACINLLKENGFLSMITMQSWMFIGSYEKLRHKLISNTLILSLLQLGIKAFEEIGNDIVQTVTFCFKNHSFNGYRGIYHQLTTHNREEKISQFFDKSKQFVIKQDDFLMINSYPIAYWIPQNLINIFSKEKKLGQLAETKIGVQTGNNELFVRFWTEVNRQEVYYDFVPPTNFIKFKWFPYTKGGSYRKWYGNNELVINWAYKGEAIKKYNKLSTINDEFYYQPCLTWGLVSSAGLNFRYIGDRSHVIGNGGPMANSHNQDLNYYLLGLLNSCVTQYIANMLNPTINLSTGTVSSIPVILDSSVYKTVVNLVKQNISICEQDYDENETSIDFQKHPLIRKVNTIEKAYRLWETETVEKCRRLKYNEELINSIFIKLYKLEKQLVPNIDEKKLSINSPILRKSIISFISYAVGCMFGRYSLDTPGIAYAGGEWDITKYKSFEADSDAIIPICDDEYFFDDIVGRFIKFIKIVFGSEHLEENISFIANALGGEGNKRDIIRSYFVNSFFSDHCDMYSIFLAGKRPIYWLFDSGKKNGFKCLVYMHRYQPDTIARIRTDYVHEQQSRYRTAMADLQNRIDNATTTSERVKLTKKLKTVREKDEELRIYEEKIHHLADQMIKIDLDDGVKVNYAKFQDVLAKIK